MYVHSVTDSEKPDDFYTFSRKRSENRGRWQRLLFRVFPLHLINQIGFETHMLWVRIRSWRAPRRFRDQRNLLVNIGAGDAGLNGWINVDGFRCKGIDCLYDVRKKMPFADNSVRAIFSEHFFEHIDYGEEAPRFLRECHRVLQPRGVLRLIVPDAGRFLHAYCEAGWQPLAELRSLDAHRADMHFDFWYNTKMELINQVFRQRNEHKFAYDAETLIFVLRQNGFEEVTQRAYRDSVLPELCIDRPERQVESLYVEAIKSAD